MTAPPDGWTRAAALADLPDGGLLGVAVGGRRLCLTRAGGAVTALDDCCTHAEFALSEGELHADGSVECAWHGARFDRATGAVVRGPACDPVAAHDVLLLDGDVLVRLAP
ncbi:Rieske 2Fe-2S domain-containing protein [Roseisolibacter sp. H3M3-2]|uniref:Rieske 2Fe-2S domain-containing protein n=1 Tax=Roseisolibacter sp. H3M3-2 TaxID=3031323 RepID=UPI0023DBF2D7|nr:Rieske 2Fe-2S domain-containing protein [Roseisolibacter sp. H3M3-2]MDF1502314.1 Rieske 2Fe-2S domain-containing protein [Roseisolibacter sp. H3M3-2]